MVVLDKRRYRLVSSHLEDRRRAPAKPPVGGVTTGSADSRARLPEIAAAVAGRSWWPAGISPWPAGYLLPPVIPASSDEPPGGEGCRFCRTAAYRFRGRPDRHRRRDNGLLLTSPRDAALCEHGRGRGEQALPADDRGTIVAPPSREQDLGTPVGPAPPSLTIPLIGPLVKHQPNQPSAWLLAARCRVLHGAPCLSGRGTVNTTCSRDRARSDSAVIVRPAVCRPARQKIAEAPRGVASSAGTTLTGRETSAYSSSGPTGPRVVEYGVIQRVQEYSRTDFPTQDVVRAHHAPTRELSLLTLRRGLRTRTNHYLSNIVCTPSQVKLAFRPPRRETLSPLSHLHGEHWLEA